MPWARPRAACRHSLHLGHWNGADFGQFFRIEVQKTFLHQLHGRLDHGAVVIVPLFIGGCGRLSGHDERPVGLVIDQVVMRGYLPVHFHRQECFGNDQGIQGGFRKKPFIYVPLADNEVQNPQEKRKVGSRTDGKPLSVGLRHFIGMPGAHHSQGQPMAKSFAELCSPTRGMMAPPRFLPTIRP